VWKKRNGEQKNPPVKLIARMGKREFFNFMDAISGIKKLLCQGPQDLAQMAGKKSCKIFRHLAHL
jgi:hypothetical protein